MEYIWAILAPPACVIFMLVVECRYLRRRVKRLETKLEQMRMVRDWINKQTEYDAAECEEHHLPGDCPLCGAE